MTPTHTPKCQAGGGESRADHPANVARMDAVLAAARRNIRQHCKQGFDGELQITGQFKDGFFHAPHVRIIKDEPVRSELPVDPGGG